MHDGMVAWYQDGGREEICTQASGRLGSAWVGGRGKKCVRQLWKIFVYRMGVSFVFLLTKTKTKTKTKTNRN
ncbi:hypothetical protein SPOG_05402 [Schizosaccharomyces cryophilus OY26]|uniref:Uncharacterized protein n=1 Tax=Schizosaccharomyces cryophilus (strain OY26 / ATCC MYA-4695 / CBS 11777 / NBRC 106824 / NRRL Y48691) TaxID=653667 RepID=S9W813_SCHCR|nr:uncharacterized protein SPOG_05402 [Schizosaccharomyces cryophilus OY26]EPY53835.1 hypothetical protein SPOG_05402 [Schizosaccharomyces cryophilus OY26]